MSACVDDVSSVERDVDSLAVVVDLLAVIVVVVVIVFVVGEVVVTVVVSGPTVQSTDDQTTTIYKGDVPLGWRRGVVVSSVGLSTNLIDTGPG